jgi:hypothetical protein
VEAGAPAFHFRLSDKLQVWTDSAADLYAQAVTAQWNADTDIDWDDAPALPAPVEDAIVQLMTYMVENENAALLVPARFLGQLHPHYRELQAALAIQVADEARHIDVFTRRIRRCQCWARAPSCTCCSSCRQRHPTPSPARSAAWPHATRRATWRWACPICSTACSRSRASSTSWPRPWSSASTPWPAPRA